MTFYDAPVDPSPLDGYDHRSWSTYIIDIPAGMVLPTRPLSQNLVGMNSDSPEALRLAEEPDYDASRYFFYNFEQIAMGHNVYGCGPLCELADEYEGHPEGKLLFVSYEGMENDPPTYVLYVQD